VNWLAVIVANFAIGLLMARIFKAAVIPILVAVVASLAYAWFALGFAAGQIEGAVAHALPVMTMAIVTLAGPLSLIGFVVGRRAWSK
jgi:hypothetical protein